MESGFVDDSGVSTIAAKREGSLITEVKWTRIRPSLLSHQKYHIAIVVGNSIMHICGKNR